MYIHSLSSMHYIPKVYLGEINTRIAGEEGKKAFQIYDLSVAANT
jgi:hypothetical protein